VPTILELLAAAGAGGLVVQYVGKGSERRTARAEVRKVLSEVDTARWQIPSDDEEDTFTEQIRTLMVTAMVAQVPRDLTERYIYAAQATRAARTAASREHLEYGKHRLVGSRIGPERDFSDYVDETRDLLVSYLWRPWPGLWRYRYGSRLRELDTKEEEEDHGERNPRRTLPRLSVLAGLGTHRGQHARRTARTLYS
jgi:hypothetical protein